MEYPVAYRTKARVTKIGLDPNSQAFKDAVRRELAFLDEIEKTRSPVNPAEVFKYDPLTPPEFGKKGLGKVALDLFEKELRRKARRTLLKFIPILGEISMAQDVGEAVGEFLGHLLEKVPGSPGTGPVGPDGLDWSTWANGLREDPAGIPQGWEHIGEPRQYILWGDREYHYSDFWNYEAPPELPYYQTVEEIPAPLPLYVGAVEELQVRRQLEISPDHKRAFHVQTHQRTDTSLDPSGNAAGTPDTVKKRAPVYVGDYVMPLPSIVEGYGKTVEETRTERKEKDEDSDRSRVESVNTVVQLGHAPVVTIGTHPLAPPGPKTKERKVIAHKMLMGIVSYAMNQITEAEDAIEALWKTLPKKSQSTSVEQWYFDKKTRTMKSYWRTRRYKKGLQFIYAKPNLNEMWADVYNHWGEVNVHDSIENLAKNQIEDLLIGSAVSRTNKNLRKWYDRSGRPVGLFTGPAL